MKLSISVLGIKLALVFMPVLFSQIAAELFTALVDLERVLYAEDNIAKDLRQYITNEEARLLKLKALADDYEKHSQEALANPEVYLANPVNAFLLVKRFTTDWDGILDEYVQVNSSQAFMDSVSSKVSLFPSGEDLTGAANALLRLQDTYDLATEKIARGDLQGVTNSPELIANDCFELGRQSYNQGDWYHTVMWMEAALLRVEKENSKTADKALILDYLAFATFQQGNHHHALNLTIAWLAIEPDHIRARNNKAYYEKLLQEQETEHRKGDEGLPPPEVKNQRHLEDYKMSEEFSTYEALCRGENIHVIPNAHTLTCQYKRHHPMFYINPLREELLYHDPWLVVYHNIITNKEMAILKELATPKLNRATAYNSQTQRYEGAIYRISKSAWLRDEVDDVVRSVSQRTMAFTNLTLDTVEELQVVNYGIGGHYEPHYDFARKHEAGSFETWRGNRILTAIYYMSDVSAGGLTVFPQLGAKVYPEKGSVAVWYNLMASGEGDYRTRHAGCPVLTGNKWVANKWFHERGQEFTRKCDLNPEL